MNYPVGVVGSLISAKKYIEQKLLPSDDFMILDSKATIDEIKQLRVFLMHRSFNRRVGIIYGLNKWKQSYQAVLLKIFEQLPEFNCVFYTASFMPSIVIQTRSEIWQLKPDKNEMLQQLMQKILNAMKYDTKDGTYSHKLIEGFKIAVQVQSWVDDGVISNKEQAIILKSIGL